MAGSTQTQLILYPQDSTGDSTYTTTPIITNLCGNSQMNQQLAFVNGYNMGYTSVQYACENSPAPLGNWAGGHTLAGSGFQACASPFTSSGGVELPQYTGSGAHLSHSWIYQRIDLSQYYGSSATFEIEIQCEVPSFRQLLCGVGYHIDLNGVEREGLPDTTYYPFPLTTGTHTLTVNWNGNTAEGVLVFIHDNQSSGSSQTSNAVISRVDLHASGSSIPLIYSDLYDGQVMVDLMKNEKIPLTLSVDNFKNAFEKVQSYSKNFTLPATKRNNKIFTHCFDIQRTSTNDVTGFNVHKKTRAILKESGHTIFEGYLKLNDILYKDGMTTYNVNLYSSPITFKDSVSDKTLRDLQISELDHEYTANNVENSWTGGLILKNPLPAGTLAGTDGSTVTDVLKYPMCNWRGDIVLNNGNTHLALDKLEDCFRPWIRISYLWNKIFEDAGYSYTSTFLNTTRFTKLFMDFNWGEGNGIGVHGNHTWEYNDQVGVQWLGTSFAVVKFDNWVSNQAVGSSYYNMTTGKMTSIANNCTIDVTYNMKVDNNSNGSRGYSCRWEHRDSAGNLLEEIDRQDGRISGSAFGDPSEKWKGSFDVVMNVGDVLYPTAKALTANKMRIHNGHDGWVRQTITNEGGRTCDTLLNKIRGNIKQWDFIKSFLDMFNLVIMVDKENATNLLIEPYIDIFVEPIHEGNTTGTTSDTKFHDWTHLVDATELKMTPLSDLHKITQFTYKMDEKDYCLDYYANQTNGYIYGAANWDADGLSMLQGTKKLENKVFAPCFIKPILDNFDNDCVVPNIYSANKDQTEFEDFANKPRIAYDVGNVTLSSGSYSIPASQNSTSGSNIFTNETTFRQFAHVTEIPTTSTTFDYNYGRCGLISPIGSAPIDNLFSIYWFPYYLELYNVDTRAVKLKIALTPKEIASFSFADQVRIKNKVFRVNKIDYKEGEISTVELILLS